MLESTSSARLVLTTAATRDEAAQLGRTLVEERLAACATLIPGAESIYRWQGRIESSAETLLLLKTASDRVAALETRLLELHSYETPEFLVLEIESGNHAYLAWMRSCLQSTDPE
jgi:periplasmic divalent cation tolerance protein